jgi:hypothetical protein
MNAHAIRRRGAPEESGAYKPLQGGEHSLVDVVRPMLIAHLAQVGAGGVCVCACVPRTVVDCGCVRSCCVPRMWRVRV